MSTRGELSGAKPRYYDRPAEFHLRDEDDWYVEPEWCVEALLDAERFEGPIWDPACGSGTIPRVCHRRGYEVYGSDIVDRGCPGWWKQDFVRDPLGRVLPYSIVTNPPYKLAETFVRRALNACTGKVAMLVQAKFLFSQQRHKLFTQQPPSTVYILSRRPSMPPGRAYLAGEVEAKGGKVDYCWLVWGHHGARHETVIRWLLPTVGPAHNNSAPTPELDLNGPE